MKTALLMLLISPVLFLLYVNMSEVKEAYCANMYMVIIWFYVRHSSNFSDKYANTKQKVSMWIAEAACLRIHQHVDQE